MRIIFISFLYEPSLGGGAANCVYSLSKEFHKRGIEVVVITSSSRQNEISEEKKGIKIIRLFPRNIYWIVEKDKQPVIKKVIWQFVDIWNPFVYRSIRSILETEKPDLIHVHKLRGLSPSVWSASSSINTPKLVHTCHDYELISPEGWLNGRIGKWAEDRVLVMRPYQFLRANMSSKVTHASAPSKYVLNKHTEMGFFKSAHTMIIPNSHGYNESELSTLRSDNKRKTSRSLRLLFLGRLVPEKGIIELCEAFSMGSKYFPDMILDVAGWGVLEEMLKKKYGSFSNIKFHGSVFGEKKEALIRNSDLLVVPSTGPESFGIVIVEAYAFGKPVIASQIGGIPEVVREGETGFLVPPGDVNELAKVIQEVARNPDMLKPMSEACLEEARSYSSNRITNKYLEFYEKT